MRLLLAVMLAGLGLVCAGAASAADGDACSSAQFSAADGNGADWCVVLCDDDNANGDCADFSFDSSSARIPDVLSFEIGTTTTCSAGTATFTTTHVSGGQSHDLGSTTAVSVTGTTRLMVDQRTQPVGEIVETTLSGLSGCGVIDIILVGYEENDS